MNTRSISHSLLRHGVAAILAGLLLSPVAAQAVDKYWIDLSGMWDVGSSWGPAGQPQNGDNVFLTQSDATDRTVSYSNTLYPSAVLGTLRIDATGTGTMTLSQTKDPLAAGFEHIGYSGTGTFTQSGGSNAVGGLILGYNSSGNGAYNLSGTATLTAPGETIGLNGTGTFTQNGGTNTTHDRLILGANSGSSGSYNLSDGNLSGAIEYIGNSGTGTFTQSGGTHALIGFHLGANAGGSGSYNLSDGNLHAAEAEIIGEGGTGSFIQTGGTNRVGGDIYVGGSNGRYSLSAGSLIIGGGGGGSTEHIGFNGIGNFTQSGGTNTMGGLSLGHSSGDTGTYTLSGGTLTVLSTPGTGDFIGNSGTGTFTQSGGTHTVTNTLTIAAKPGSNGTYNLSGGTLTAGSMINNGAFNYSGGSLNATTITNNGAATLSGAGTRTVNGAVVNNGSVKVTNTTVNITGTFTNNGSYVSDPATSQFTDLIVNSTGYLTGGAGDGFIIGGDFINHSLQNTLWNTGHAELLLSGAGLHNLYLAGADLGNFASGRNNNFAWGEFSLGSGVSLRLWDGNADPGAALYVGLFDLADGAGQLSNIYGDYNIYYDATLAGNSYLGDKSYALNGRGFLMPAAVPIPPAVWLFGSGLLGLIGVARRKRR